MHLPLVKGRTNPKVTVTFSEPVAPAYSFVPETTGTGSVTANMPEQVVLFHVVGPTLLLFRAALSCFVSIRMLPFCSFSSF